MSGVVHFSRRLWNEVVGKSFVSDIYAAYPPTFVGVGKLEWVAGLGASG